MHQCLYLGLQCVYKDSHVLLLEKTEDKVGRWLLFRPGISPWDQRTNLSLQYIQSFEEAGWEKHRKCTAFLSLGLVKHINSHVIYSL